MFERNLTRKEVELIEQVEEFIREKHKADTGHDYSHVLAVTSYAIQIARSIREEVNPFILIVGALFHDLGRTTTHTGILHGIRGATFVEEWLNSTWVSPSDRETILRIVARHTPTTMIPPETIEERIVYDADALDRLGLNGMLRGIMGKQGSTEAILEDRMRKRLGDFGKLHFEASREIGQSKHHETLQVVGRFREMLDDLELELASIPWPIPEGVELKVPLPSRVVGSTDV
ncbi:MAG: HD domain-containing protein [Chloroflexota bacterium]|nr:HD domain-containing protein [Chloroflexota bacterium]